MQILNNSKTLSKQERCQRFVDLINMNFYKEIGQDDVIQGQLIGAGLLWARAEFDKKCNETVQVNTWVKITIEIFTRIKGDGICLENINAKFNES
jgi:hypothetical protein